MKNLLLTCLLICLTTLVSAQCVSTCSPCTKPTITGVVADGATLGVGWNNNWYWGYGCSKSVSILVDGVEYAPNGLFTPGMALYGNAVSSAEVSGYTVTAGSTICVVVRNYCGSPYTCDLANFVDSDPTCITVPGAPVVAPAVVVDCYCPNGQFKVKKGNSYKCANQYNCIKWLSKGWTSDCNCQ